MYRTGCLHWSAAWWLKVGNNEHAYPIDGVNQWEALTDPHATHTNNTSTDNNYYYRSY